MHENLKAARKAKGLTQEQMAQLLHLKSKGHYCMIERGQRGMSVNTALKIAEILGQTVESLFLRKPFTLR